MVICIYVDALITTGNEDIGTKEVKNMLKVRFKVSNLGELKYFIGIKVIKSISIYA